MKSKIIDISAPFSSENQGECTTRMYAPACLMPDGMGIVDIPAETFIGPCRVINVNEFVTGASIDEMFLHGCERVIFKGNGKASLMTAAAEELADIGIKLIGIDSSSIATENERESVYTTLFSSDCCIIEGLDLSDVDAQGDYYLIAPPVKAEGQAIAPVRALLVDKYLYWNKPELFGV